MGSKSPENSETDLLACLDRGLPAIIQSDIYHLPYYQSSTHFPGHLITVWGYDAQRRVFFVTDTERPDVQEVPFENMKAARELATMLGGHKISQGKETPQNTFLH